MASGVYKGIPIERAHSGNQVEVDEVLEHSRIDSQLHYQKLDPWVKNICQKLSSKKFKPALLVPAIEKYAVPCAIDRYVGTAGAHKDWSKTTKRLIATRLSKQLIGTAKTHLSSGKKCRLYESHRAKEYVEGGHKGHPPFC